MLLPPRPPPWARFLLAPRARDVTTCAALWPLPALFQGITITKFDFCGVFLMKSLLYLAFLHPARNGCGKEVISGLVLTFSHGINFPLNDRFIGVFFICAV